MNFRHPNKGDLGYVEKTKIARQKGGGRVKGKADITFDTHALSVIIESMNNQIQKFERKMIDTPLDEGEQDKYDYRLYLRETIESIRNETLEE